MTSAVALPITVWSKINPLSGDVRVKRAVRHFNMMKLLLSLAIILPSMATITTAGKTAPLDDAQMDKVTAGTQTFSIMEDVPSLLAENIITVTIMAGSFGEIPAGVITAGFLSLPAQSISTPSTTITVTSALP